MLPRSNQWISISGAIWRGTLLPRLIEYLPESSKSKAAAIFQSIVVAQKFTAGSVERNAIDLAYRESQQKLAIAATVVLVPSLVAMWFIKNVDLTQDQKKAEETHNTNEESYDPNKNDMCRGTK